MLKVPPVHPFYVHGDVRNSDSTLNLPAFSLLSVFVTKTLFYGQNTFKIWFEQS